MSWLQKFVSLFRRKRLILVDPVFGEIEYEPRIKMWALDNWPMTGKLSELREFTLYADETGPDESHRIAFQRMLEEYDSTICEIRKLLDEDYRLWYRRLQEYHGDDELTKIKGFPILESPEDVLAHARFFRITVVGANKVGGDPNCDLWIDVEIDWEEEHDREFSLRDGKISSWGS